MTVWVRMQRKVSQRTWRRETGGKFRIPPETAEVEIRSTGRYGHRAAAARVMLQLATEAGLVPGVPVSGTHYRLPLCLTAGCRSCHTRHKEGECLSTPTSP